MKLLILMLIPAIVAAQSIVIENPINNILYKGIANPVTFEIRGYDSNNLVLKTDNGIVEDLGNNKFFITPNRIGDMQILFYDQLDVKIGEKAMFVEELPLIVGLKYPFDQDGNPVISMASGLEIYVDQPNISLEVRPVQWQYEILILRKHKVIYYHKFESQKFSNELRQMLSKIQQDDILIIRDILVKFKDNGSFKLSDLSFKI